MRRYLFAPIAEQDIDEIITYIAEVMLAQPGKCWIVFLKQWICWQSIQK